MIQKSYIALFSAPHTTEDVESYVLSWLERFDTVEQVVPKRGAGDYTLSIKSPKDLMTDEHLQFRVMQEADFAWIYLSIGKIAIETTSLPAAEISIALDVLLELNGVIEIIDGQNERRIEALEKQGIL
jgi:hypothetical protein